MDTMLDGDRLGDGFYFIIEPHLLKFENGAQNGILKCILNKADPWLIIPGSHSQDHTGPHMNISVLPV